MFKIENLKYKNILDVKNLEIRPNIVTTIVGKSGSGKTTLLKLLNKLISPESGTVYYLGNDLEKVDSIAHRRNVVMLSQTPVVFAGSVKDNLLIGLDFSEKPHPSDDKLIEVLHKVQLNLSLSADADKLSGGEKQRLSLGRILLMNPEVYLLDEPSSALDKETEGIVISTLYTHVKETNKTLIMVSHSTEVADDYSDCIIKMENGSVIDMKEV